MYDVEILYLARRAGYRLQQVGIHWRDDGDSRLVLVAGNIRNVVDVLSIRLGSRKRSQRPLLSEHQVAAKAEEL